MIYFYNKNIALNPKQYGFKNPEKMLSSIKQIKIVNLDGEINFINKNLKYIKQHNLQKFQNVKIPKNDSIKLEKKKFIFSNK